MSRFTRRSLLTAPVASLPLVGQRGQSTATEKRRYADGTTENEVFRLTDPAHASYLPSLSGHCVARNNSVLYGSERSGRVQVHRMDLKSGESRQLTDGAAIEPNSVALLPDERTFVYLDGQTLKRSDGRDLYQAPHPCEPGVAVTDDGLFCFLTERNGSRWRIQQVPLLARGTAKTLVESEQRLGGLRPRPRRASLLYLRDGGLHLVTFDGQTKALRTEGHVSQVEWNPEGRTALYLTRSAEERPQATLRELEPDRGADQFFCRTSQFAYFARNADGSVLVGLSSSVASPLVLLLLRITRREFPLCEHRGKAVAVPPVFTPNSQRVIFQGDRDGKPALYMLALEKLVEKTEETENR